MSDCIFCKIVSGEIKTEFVYEDDEFAAFKDIDPQAPVHILIITKKHIPTLNDLSPEDSGLAGKMIIAGVNIAKNYGTLEKGYRLVLNCKEQGGQAVFHIHLHLLGGRSMKWPPG